MKYVLSLLILTAISLTACSEKDSKPEGVLTNTQEKALKDAKAVNDTILNADEDRQKKIDEMTE